MLIIWSLFAKITKISGFLVNKIKGNVDIEMISEKKLDDTFSNGQFLIGGFVMNQSD